ncbi:MAG: toxin-antitoxin system YwqK family antitoxin [Flavobacteriales bacterium]
MSPHSIKPFRIPILILLFSLSGGYFATPSMGQNSVFLKEQVPEKKKYEPKKVIDSVYGIEMYKPLNFRLGGDSVRKCGDYACRSWVEDKYKNGQVMHKGYYVDGQLKIYKNFYPDGTKEREFKILSKLKSKMIKYYPDGKVKSKVTYLGESPVEWTDLYKNGQVKYHEKYDDGRNYHIERASYQKDGTPKEKFKMVDKKKKLFVKKTFYPSGDLKLKGRLKYNDEMLELQKHGKWEHYDKEGNVKRTVTYDKGEKINEK